MDVHNKYLRSLGLMLSGIFVLSSIFLLTTSVKAEEPNQPTDDYCLSCHADPQLSVILPSGESLSLFVDPEIHGNSVHTDAGIECHACHTDIATYPHPEMVYASVRELSRNYYLACRQCHAINYEKTLDSMHAQVAEAGNLEAPVCTDCHTAHYVQEPDNPRTLISDTCGNIRSKYPWRRSHRRG